MLTSTRENPRARAANSGAGPSSRELPYSFFLAFYVGLWVLFLVLVRALGIPWPREVGAIDLLLLSLATFRLTEMITEEKVARTLRAPFCEQIVVTDPDGTEREEEVPAGEGLRRVCGELVLCPWCSGIWIATGLTFFWVLAPGPARLVMLAFGISAAGMIFQILTKLMDRTRNSLPPDR